MVLFQQMYCVNNYWSFSRKTLLDDKVKVQTLISSEMCAFQLKMHEMHKTADFHAKLLVSWELMIERYQGRPLKCAYFTHFTKDPYQVC